MANNEGDSHMFESNKNKVKRLNPNKEKNKKQKKV